MTNKTVVKTNSVEQTRQVGAQLASTLVGGELILLNGDLGAGKTAFCQGLFEGLECEGYCTSPTFAIANVHEGRLTFAHLDLYRISTEEDAAVAGLYDYIEDGAVVAVEWPAQLPSLYQLPHISVNITYNGETERNINITKVNP